MTPDRVARALATQFAAAAATDCHVVPELPWEDPAGGYVFEVGLVDGAGVPTGLTGRVVVTVDGGS